MRLSNFFRAITKSIMSCPFLTSLPVRVCTGEWKADKWWGEGTATFPNGGRYTGGWRDDRREGTGKETFAAGGSYEGGWVSDRREGLGREIWPNGDVYEGEYVQGQMEGHGICRYADGRVYEGEWCKGKWWGEGTAIFANGNKYSGGWRASRREGRGKQVYHSDNGSYDGDWLNDKKHGRGLEIWGNGDMYEGEYKDGHRDGHGVFTSHTGEVYEGKFREGKRHGQGKLIKPDLTEQWGVWHHGAFQGKQLSDRASSARAHLQAKLKQRKQAREGCVESGDGHGGDAESGSLGGGSAGGNGTSDSHRRAAEAAEAAAAELLAEEENNKKAAEDKKKRKQKKAKAKKRAKAEARAATALLHEPASDKVADDTSVAGTAVGEMHSPPAAACSKPTAGQTMTVSNAAQELLRSPVSVTTAAIANLDLNWESHSAQSTSDEVNEWEAVGRAGKKKKNRNRHLSDGNKSQAPMTGMDSSPSECSDGVHTANSATDSHESIVKISSTRQAPDKRAMHLSIQAVGNQIHAKSRGTAIAHDDVPSTDLFEHPGGGSGDNSMACVQHLSARSSCSVWQVGNETIEKKGGTPSALRSAGQVEGGAHQHRQSGIVTDVPPKSQPCAVELSTIGHDAAIENTAREAMPQLCSNDNLQQETAEASLSVTENPLQRVHRNSQQHQPAAEAHGYSLFGGLNGGLGGTFVSNAPTGNSGADIAGAAFSLFGGPSLGSAVVPVASQQPTREASPHTAFPGAGAIMNASAGGGTTSCATHAVQNSAVLQQQQTQQVAMRLPEHLLSATLNTSTGQHAPYMTFARRGTAAGEQAQAHTDCAHLAEESSEGIDTSTSIGAAPAAVMDHQMMDHQVRLYLGGGGIT